MNPLILHPATPTELLTHVLNHRRHPTTLVIASAKQPFLDALAHQVDTSPQDPQSIQVLHKTLIQTAVSRHIRVAFAPTPAHLRAYLAAFAPRDDDGIIPAAPPPGGAAHVVSRGGPPPLLLVYGFLEVHRLTSEWSAQGIAGSAAALVEAAARTRLRAAVVEPRGGGDGFDSLEEFLAEGVPMLSGAARTDSGAWAGRNVEAGRVLGRWFVPDREHHVI